MRYEYEQTSFPNRKFNLDSLKKSIENSNITIRVDSFSGISSGPNCGCAINFLAPLSPQEVAILNDIIFNHTGESLAENADINSLGIPKVVVTNDIDISSTWIAKGNICDPNLVLPLVWKPNIGKKLLVTGTMMVLTKDVNMNKKMSFIGTNTGESGNKNFTREYNELWDYQYACDEYYEFSDHIRMLWRYSPIVLKYSNNAKIEVHMPDGAQYGSNGMVKLICLSENE